MDFKSLLRQLMKVKSATIGFFIFSVIWSLKSCAKTSVMIKAEAKSFLPLAAKMLLYLRYIVLYT